MSVAFASAFVSAMSVGNLGGRIVWPALSDYLGRKGVGSLIKTPSKTHKIERERERAKSTEEKSNLPLKKGLLYRVIFPVYP